MLFLVFIRQKSRWNLFPSEGRRGRDVIAIEAASRPMASVGVRGCCPKDCQTSAFTRKEGKAKSIKKKDQAQGQRQHSREKLFLTQVLEGGQLLEEGFNPGKVNILPGNFLIKRTQLGKVLSKVRRPIRQPPLFDFVQE